MAILSQNKLPQQLSYWDISVENLHMLTYRNNKEPYKVPRKTFFNSSLVTFSHSISQSRNNAITTQLLGRHLFTAEFLNTLLPLGMTENCRKTINPLSLNDAITHYMSAAALPQ